MSGEGSGPVRARGRHRGGMVLARGSLATELLVRTALEINMKNEKQEEEEEDEEDEKSVG